MGQEIIVEMDIKDEIGNDFRAQVTFTLRELEGILKKNGYKISKI